MPDHVREQREFLDSQLRPRLDAALAGREHVFFVDAAHFVFGTFLCCLWSIARVFVRAASGRQRFNVLGAWNAVTRELVAITNTTVVNSDTMCELLRAIASRGLIGPVTLVLDNARYQRNALVQGLAKELGIALLFLPSYSPNLNLIERLWRFLKRKAAYGRYHPTFADFRAAIEEVLGGISTTHANKLATLMTLNFQEFEDVSLLAAWSIMCTATRPHEPSPCSEESGITKGVKAVLRNPLAKKEGNHEKGSVAGPCVTNQRGCVVPRDVAGNGR